MDTRKTPSDIKWGCTKFPKQKHPKGQSMMRENNKTQINPKEQKPTKKKRFLRKDMKISKTGHEFIPYQKMISNSTAKTYDSSFLWI